MGNEASQLRAGDIVARQDLGRDLQHLAHGKLVDRLPVLVDVVHLLVHGLVAGGIEAAAGLQIQHLRARTVDLMHIIDEADLAFCARFEEDTSAAVAK